MTWAGRGRILPYSVAVVGCGRIGARAEADAVAPKPASHCGVWAGQPGVRLEAVCDVAADPVCAAGSAYYATPYLSLGAMLKAVRPDIISVATPAPTHVGIVREICAAGRAKAVVCEKPLATSAKDARETEEACRAAGILLFVNHQRRFSPLLQAEQGHFRRRIGTPTLAVGHYSGGLWEGGSHLVDLLRWFLGEASDIRALPAGHASLSFGGTPAALLAHDIARYVMFGAELYGEAGMVEIGDYGRSVVPWRAENGYPLAGGYRHLVPVAAPDSDPASLMAQMAKHVVAVLDGRAAPVSTGADGVAAVDILEAIAPWPG